MRIQTVFAILTVHGVSHESETFLSNMNVNALNEQAGSPGAMELREIVLELWLRRWWLLLGVVVCTLAAAGAAFLVPPVYRSSTVLVSAPSSSDTVTGSLGSALGQLGGLASLAGISAGPDSADEAMAVLRSRQFTERFLTENGVLPEMYPKLWDAAAGKWRVTGDDEPTLGRAYKMFDEQIRSIVQDKKTGLVSINIDWTDRERAAFWANDLVLRLNAEMRKRAIVQAEASLEFLRNEAAGTQEVATRESIGRLMEAQIQRRMLANVSPEYAFRVVDKAMPPDKDDILRPNRTLLLLGAPILGLGLGIIGVLMVRLLRGSRR